MDERISVGIIGGTCVYEIEGLRVIERRVIDTPFGAPSAPVTIGILGDRMVAFIPRHGTNHEFNPSAVPYRANIWALKSLGVFWVIGVQAVGSLKEEIAPGDFVIPDQVIDKTYRRPNTLYDDFVVHAGLTHPFHPMLRDVLLRAARSVEDLEVHDGGTYVCMEGPAFSTLAESQLHRSWGASLIGMTAMPEARLAREAEQCYASICMPTDYDVWHTSDNVNINEIRDVMERNTIHIKKVLAQAIREIPFELEEECDASRALRYAIITKPDAISEKAKKDFALILDKYL